MFKSRRPISGGANIPSMRSLKLNRNPKLNTVDNSHTKRDVEQITVMAVNAVLEHQIKHAYKEILKRVASPKEVSVWAGVADISGGMDAVRAGLASSVEGKEVAQKAELRIFKESLSVSDIKHKRERRNSSHANIGLGEDKQRAEEHLAEVVNIPVVTREASSRENAHGRLNGTYVNSDKGYTVNNAGHLQSSKGMVENLEAYNEDSVERKKTLIEDEDFLSKLNPTRIDTEVNEFPSINSRGVASNSLRNHTILNFAVSSGSSRNEVNNALIPLVTSSILGYMPARTMLHSGRGSVFVVGRVRRNVGIYS